MSLYYKITTIAFILIFIGMTVMLESVVKDVEEKDKEIIELKQKCLCNNK